MRKIGLLFFLLYNILAFGQSTKTLEIEFPKIVFGGIETELKLISESLLPDTLIINGENIPVKSQSGESFVNIVVPNSEKIDVNGFVVMHKTINIIPLWTSLLPPLIAILLALIFKEVVFSLLSGIFIGAAIMGYYADGFPGIFTGFLKIIDTYLIDAMNDGGHLSVILFSLLIGGIVAVISKNGGMQGVVNSIAKLASNTRNGQLATWGLGVAIFFDDYANTLVVGNTMRAVTDKLKISREKLAYIVDSTAAPVSAIAFVTTWIGAELVYISSGLSQINANGREISEGVYSIFLNSLQYSFYPILTLFFIFYLIWRGKDFGPMLKAETKARLSTPNLVKTESPSIEELKDLEPAAGVRHRGINAILPILIIVAGTLLGLIYTGFEALANDISSISKSAKVHSWTKIWSNIPLLEGNPNTFTQKIGTLIGAADSYLALLWSSLSALIVAIIMSVGQRIFSLKQSVETTISGFKTMIPAMIILILAWALAAVTEEMHTATYLTGIFEETIPAWLIPAITFILSAFVAFSTGSSWSTMALVYPIILPTAWILCKNDGYAATEAMGIFYNVVSAVLAGSVLGDHCSPISDTTILSSLASGCDHVKHVKTQMPYALTVGAVAVTLGIIPSALGVSPLLCFLFSGLALVLIIDLLGKRIPSKKDG